MVDFSRRCPTCNEVLDADTHHDFDPSKTPDPGDMSVCAYCGVALFYTESLGLRLVTDEEWKNLPDEHKALVEKARRAAVFFKPIRPRRPNG